MFHRIKKISIISLVCVCVCLCFPLVGCGGKQGGSTSDIAPHLISTPEENPERPIDSRETEELPRILADFSDSDYRERVELLYSVVVDGRKKPVFVYNDPVKPVYDAAIAILDRYILNSWHDGSEQGQFNIVHTIHDYLVLNSEYDYSLYERYLGGADVAGDPAFHIDGALVNKLTVCDGYSRAFEFLCAIEGIESYRVTGTFAGVAHAWNKVKVGDNLYNLDITADCANYSVNDGNIEKQLSHGYFMLSDATYREFSAKPFNSGAAPNRHVFDANGNNALSDYDYYDGKVILIGEKAFPCVIKSAEMLNNLFSAIGDGKSVGKIEVKLDFPGKSNVNDANMYADEIEEAYKLLKSPDFSITPTQRPYFQYPNGVYLFLMYL